MKSIVLDSGPIISLTMNNLLWILEPLSRLSNMTFYIPESVKRELVEEPMETKRFMFEAFQVQELINRNVLRIYDDRFTKSDTLELLNIANSCFRARGQALTLFHYGEIAAIAASMSSKSLALVMDERVTREMLEHPMHLAKLMGRKLNTRVEVNRENLKNFREKTKNVNVIRSTELAAVAFEKGLLDRFVATEIPNSRTALLESVLWGLKLDGCAINERGIKAIVNAEVKR